MKILFDIVHPADVHFFKHAITTLKKHEVSVLVVSRGKDITCELLDQLGIEHTLITRKFSGTFGAILELIFRDYKLWRIARSFKPDLMVSNNSPCAAHVAWLQRTKSVVFEDTEINKLNHLLYYPFVSEIHTPVSYRFTLGSKQIRYLGYHPLAYLHPNHFKPREEIRLKYGLEPGQKLIIVRFVKHDALHDLGYSGLTTSQKLILIKNMQQLGRVVVSSEGSPPPGFELEANTISCTDMHDLMALSDLVVGESATMCSEAICMGIPAILLDEKGRGYIDDQAVRYKLAFWYSPKQFGEALEKAKAILGNRVVVESSTTRTEVDGKSILENLLSEMVDVSEYQLAQFKRLVGNSAQ